MTVQEFFEANRALIYSLYGQVFFVLGLAIALSIRRKSEMPLARTLWLLSVFGFLHAFYEWSYVVLPVQKSYLTVEKYRLLEILQRPLEAISFAFLLQFGIAVYLLSRPVLLLRPLPGLLFLLWLVGYFYGLPPPQENFRSYSNLADLWARYLLCFPGACLSAYGLVLQVRRAKEMGAQQVEGYLRGAAFSFLLYALIAGLLVPPAPFFPASWLNRRLLSSYLGVPPPVARVLAGLLITYFMIRSLKIFDLEVGRLIEETKRREALIDDRERISREIHDGILQNLYGAGLHLESAAASLPPNAHSAAEIIRHVVHSLNRSMAEIRNYIVDLKWQERMDYEAEIRKLVEGKPGLDGLGTHFEIIGRRPEHLPATVTLQLYHFAQEAITNVRKHAKATHLKVVLAYAPRELMLSVSDDGVGFVWDEVQKTANPWQQGLKNMVRRAELLGGKVAIETGAGKGTKVSLQIPFRANAT